MINVKNQFQDDSLEIEFSGECINTINISLEVVNDVNFKPVIDYLINIIPNKKILDFYFEKFEDEEKEEKLCLIKETIEEIYKEFNTSIDDMLNKDDNDQEDNAKDDSDPEGDCLPF